jgi:hypothetical protein
LLQLTLPKCRYKPTALCKASAATNPAKSVHATATAVTVDRAAIVVTVATAPKKPVTIPTNRNRSLTSPAPRQRKTHPLRLRQLKYK